MTDQQQPEKPPAAHPAPPSTRKMFSGFRLVGVLLSVSLFAVSLTGYGYAAGDPAKPQNWAHCFLLLLVGWMGLFDGIPAWLANPTIAVAWVCGLTRFRWLTLVLSALALLLALSFLFQRDILINEAGHRGPVTAIGQGYRIWLLSMAFLALWTVVDQVLHPQNH